jgi:WD40 repeat protein
MILAGHLASAADLRRFHSEAEAGAHLDHPHLVPIFEVGEHEGQPFFSMKFMEGGSLAQAVANGTWEARGKEGQRRAAQLLATVARTVEYAHQRGILHRDLKPANILFDAQGRPHVSDFGLSKRVHIPGGADQARGGTLTQSGAIVGTPSYMAPEQAESPRGLTTAADIYSLGAILYELLAGKPPFRADTPLETLRQVKDVEAPKLRTFDAGIDRDLETVVLKCLEKDPRRRYRSAAALAEELERWLAGEPILARPAGAWTRTMKWARRRPAAAALTSLLAGSMLLGLGGAIWNWQAAEEAKRKETFRANAEAAAKRELALRLYFRNIALAQFEIGETNVSRASASLDECAPDLRGWEWHFLNRQCHAELMTLRNHTERVVSLAFSGDGQRLASVSSSCLIRWRGEGQSYGRSYSMSGPKTATVRIFRTADGRELLNFAHQGDFIFRIAISPDGQRVACAGGKDEVAEIGPGIVKVWDAMSGRELLNITGHKTMVHAVAFSPDGTRLATADHDATARIWDAKTGQPLLTLASRGVGDGSLIQDVLFSPDGSRIATAHLDCTVHIWDATLGKELRTLRGHSWNVTRMAFSPDGERLATASEDHTIKVWKHDTGQELRALVGHTDGVNGVAFSPDGKRLVTAASDNTAKVWDSSTGLLLFTLPGHSDSVTDEAYSPDGERIATASLDSTIKLWNAPRAPAAESSKALGDPIVFSPDRRQLASWGFEKNVATIFVFDAATRKQVLAFKGHEKQIDMMAYSPDGKRLASASQDGTLCIWDPATGKAVLTLRGRPANVAGLAYSPDGKRIACCWVGETTKVWDADSGQEIIKFDDRPGAVAFSPDGSRLALGGYRGISVVDATTGKELYVTGGPYFIYWYSVDGSRLFALGSGGVHIFDSTTGRELTTQRLPAGANGYNHAAISPDRRRLAVPYAKHRILLWDLTSGQEALTLRGHGEDVFHITFTPDGQQLASVDGAGTMIVWNATPLP